MVSWPEHANLWHDMPHNDDVLLDSSRKGNLISGPCLLHLDGGQYVKKSWSSHALASSVPWLTRASRRVLVSDVEGENQCPPFSCGDLHNISYPFRRPGDPAECGVASYELVCSNSKAIIDINTGTYYVTGINYTSSYFWAVDANLDMNSSCPLPQWNQFPYPSWRLVSSQLIDLVTGGTWACFLNCSRAITNNSRYKPVTCLSTTNSFVYVLASGYCSIGQLEPSCGYFAMIPFGLRDNFQSGLQGQDASYAGIAEFTRKGFAVGFPVGENSRKYSFPEIIKKCLNNSTSYFKQQISGAGILHWARAFFWSDIHFLECLIVCDSSTVSLNVLGRAIISFPKFLAVLCRFVLAPLVVMIFLAFKYWKTKITVNAVDKFLRMQEMLGPMSFGMLLLEMAGGRRNADPNAAKSSQAYYPSWVYDRLTEQGVGEISLAAEMHELERKLCIVGLWCIQMKSHDRPAMSDVIEMLEAGVDILQMPSRPFFCDEGRIHVEDSYHLSSELTVIPEEDEQNAHL
ncbi:hypothetical protein ACQ4PT_006055 [Festuca glaucescens]